MKFVNLRTKRTHERAKLHQRSGAVPQYVTKITGTPHQIHTYAELRQQIHDDLRIQHPEWVQPNGDCPKCDAYETRLTKLLETLKGRDANEWAVALHRAVEHGPN